MKLKVFTFLTVVIFSIAHTAVGEKINIKFKDKLTLPEKQMVLSDVAEVSCNDPSLLKKINNIYIGNTPCPGNVRKIERDIISARLMDQGIKPSEITYGSTTSSLVSVESIIIPGNEIEKKAREFLSSKLSRPENEMIIESDRPPRDILLPDSEGVIHFEVSQIDANKDRGNIQLIVRIFINDKQYLKIPVFFNIRVYEDIVVSNKKINRHDILDTADLVVKRMETTKFADITFDNVKDLVGKRAISPIQPNTPITAEIIDNPPAIKKGDFIKVLVQSDNFHITTKGVAKEDGYLGKIIRVKNIDSNKELYGKVEDSATVKIIF